MGYPHYEVKSFLKKYEMWAYGILVILLVVINLVLVLILIRLNNLPKQNLENISSLSSGRKVGRSNKN